MNGRRLNLTAVLALLAVLELVINRIVGHLFVPMSRANTLPGSVLGETGTFLFYLVGVLGLWLFAAGLTGLLLRREFFPQTVRLTAALFGLFFVFFAGPGTVFGQLPPRLFVHLQTSQGFVAWTLALACWRNVAPLRAKVGVTLFALPSILHAAGLFGAQMGWGRGEQLAADLFSASELVGLFAGAASPVLLSPRPFAGSARALALTWCAGAAVLGLLVAGLVANFELIQMMALYGLRLDIPPLRSAQAILYLALLAVSAWGLTTCILQCLVTPGGTRLAGYGLILVASAGHQVSTVSQLVLAAAGLVALAVGTARAAHPAAARFAT